LLGSRGVGAGNIVVLYLDHSLEVLCAVLGVLKVGAAYAPVEPDTPSERLGVILRDLADGTGTRPAIITQASLRKRIPTSGEPVIEVDSRLSVLDGIDEADLPSAAGPASLAYMIFTSGSTGTPKG